MPAFQQLDPATFFTVIGYTGIRVRNKENFLVTGRDFKIPLSFTFFPYYIFISFNYVWKSSFFNQQQGTYRFF